MFGWTLHDIRQLTPGQFQRWSKRAAQMYGIELMYQVKITSLPWIEKDGDRMRIIDQIAELASGETVDHSRDVDDLRAAMTGVRNEQ